jgi:hypothetical protein
MPSRLDYVDAALDVPRVVLPNDPPLPSAKGRAAEFAV